MREPLGRVKIFRWVPLDVAVEHQKAVKTARSAHRASYRRGCQPVTRHACDPFPQMLAFKVFRASSALTGPGLEFGDVPRIALQSIDGQPFFHLDIGEKFTYQIALGCSFAHGS